MRTLILVVVALLSARAASSQEKWAPVHAHTDGTEVNLDSIQRDGSSASAVVRATAGPGSMTYQWVLVDCTGLRLRVTKSSMLDTETGRWSPAADSTFAKDWTRYPDGSLGHGIVMRICRGPARRS